VNQNNNISTKFIFTLATIGAMSLIISVLASTNSYAAIQNLTFPVLGSSSYSNDFKAPRNHCGTNPCYHDATDIIAEKKQKIVSASTGVIKYVTKNDTEWGGAGYSVRVLGDDNHVYNYYHLNNDNSATDDGNGGRTRAYAPDIKAGNRITKGQHLGYVGDSGNAEGTVPHLHFEIYDIRNGGTWGYPANGGKVVNPYPHLNRAETITSPRDYPKLAGEILPYGNTAKVPVNIAIGKFGPKSSAETVTGAGFGGGPDIRVFNNQGAQISKFLAYDNKFRGGVDVATGDVNGDGEDNIITAPGPSGGPDIKVFKKDGTLIGQFLAYDAPNRDGVHVTTGDIDGDGKKEVITGPRAGSGAHVKVFKLDGTLVKEFFAYNREFRGGIDVAAGNILGSGKDNIVTGPGPRGGPDVKVFKDNGTQLSQFFAYDRANRSGVRVSVGNTLGDSKAEIVTVPASGGGPNVRVFNSTGNLQRNNMFLEDWWRSGYDVAAGHSITKATAGDQARRSTLRSGL